MSRARLAEALVLTLLLTIAAAAVPLTQGHLGWSWDALNHHVYLGLTAEHPRWDLDVIPASYQTYQYPYLYWPVYRLSLLPLPGAVAGAAWSAFQALLVVPPVWLICHRLLPLAGTAWKGMVERTGATVLAFMSVVVLAALETTANDLLASVPLLWAIAVGLKGRSSDRQASLAAALWGMATAFKLSNGLYVGWLLLWWWLPQRPHLPLKRGLALGAGALLGFCVTYAPWAWQLWRATGNPFYPYFASVFGAGS